MMLLLISCDGIRFARASCAFMTAFAKQKNVRIVSHSPNGLRISERFYVFEAAVAVWGHEAEVLQLSFPWVRVSTTTVRRVVEEVGRTT